MIEIYSGSLSPPLALMPTRLSNIRKRSAGMTKAHAARVRQQKADREKLSTLFSTNFSRH